MLIAMDKDGSRVLAAEARRGEAYRCPACGAPVVYKQGRWVTAHYAHRPTVPCPYTSEPESAAHLAMKTQMYERFRAELWVRHCEVERIIGAYRTDVWLETAIGPVAIECQISSVTILELADKLTAYADAGVATLYLIHHTLFASLSDGVEQRVPSWVLALHALYRGRLYVYGADGEIAVVHLAPVFRENQWIEGAPARRLKTTRRVQRGLPIHCLELRSLIVPCDYGALAGGIYVIASFNDHVFWTHATSSPPHTAEA